MLNTISLLDPRKLALLKEIPITIVQGKNDTICYKGVAEDLAAALKRSGNPVDLRIIENGKHSSYGQEMTDALVRATDQFDLVLA